MFRPHIPATAGRSVTMSDFCDHLGELATGKSVVPCTAYLPMRQMLDWPTLREGERVTITAWCEPDGVAMIRGCDGESGPLAVEDIADVQERLGIIQEFSDQPTLYVVGVRVDSWPFSLAASGE